MIKIQFHAVPRSCSILGYIDFKDIFATTATVLLYTGGPFMARTWFGEIGPCCCSPPLLNLPAAFSQPRANHKVVPNTLHANSYYINE